MPKVAKTTCRVAGFRSMLQRGKVYEDNDPIVKARPDLFEAPESFARRTAQATNTDELGAKSMSARGKEQPVERATAEPGEKRSTRRKDADK